MCFCLNLLQILVVGGGDGGIVRELDKHSSVEKIIVSEIDEVGHVLL